MANGVYWLGQDGQVYVKGGQGVNSAGAIDKNTHQYWGSRGYNLVANPNPGSGNSGQASRSSESFGDTGGQVDTGWGGTAAPAYSGAGSSGADSGASAAEAQRRAQAQAAISNTQKAIDSLGTELNVGYGNIDAEAGSLLSRYDRESKSNEKDYKGQTVNNNQNLLKNKQNALQAAAQGARGLRSTLASIGALGGTGQVLANRAVTNSANQDIGEASETAAGNAQTLDRAIGKFREDDETRRAELETQKRNRRTALEGNVESKRQNYFQKMAELYSGLGDAGNATNYLNQAGDLNSTIAQKTAVAATPFSARAAAFTPGTLSEYLAGTGDMTVTTAEGDATGLGASPSSILAGRKDEKRKQSQPAVA